MDSLCDGRERMMMAEYKPKTEYVVGFLFSKERDRVVLIQKNRPDWQSGDLNGVGGHVNPGETYAQAMRREFLEEAGLDVPDWEEVASAECPTVRIVFFRAFGDLSGVRVGEQSLTDERVRLAYLGNLFMNGSNSAGTKMVWPSGWIIGMCLDEELVLPVGISYKTDGRRRR